MTENSTICNDCGEVSCHTTCSSRTKNNVLDEGQRLKSLIPSCNLSDANIVKRRDELGKRGIFLKVTEVRELLDGLDFVFKEPKEFTQEILDYVDFERNCCSGFSFAVEFEPNFGPVHLKIFGSNGVKKQMKNAVVELGIGSKMNR